MAGGTYRIKVDANVPVKMTKWNLLWPEGKENDPIYDVSVDTYFKEPLFMYENKPRIPYQATLSDDGQYLEIKMEARLKKNANTSRVVYTNPEEGQIVGTGDEWIVFSSSALSLDRTKILYQLSVVCRNR